MNLTALTYFIAVAEYKSFTRASEFLYVTQPTLSRQIADLEAELGVQLLNRSKRSVTLTDAGEICLAEAKEIVSRCDRLAQRLKTSSDGGEKNLKIGYQGVIEGSLLLDSVRGISEKVPDLNLGLRHASLAEINQFLLDGEVDVIFTVEAGMKNLPGIDYIRAAGNELQIAVPEGHRFAGRDSVMVEELKDEHFILFERSYTPLTVDYTLKMCMNHGFSPSVVYYAQDPQSMMLMVGAGKGIAFLSSRLSGKSFESVKFVKLSNCEIDFDLVLAYRRDNDNPMLPLFLSAFSAE